MFPDSRLARARHRLRRARHRSGRTQVFEFSGIAAFSQGRELYGLYEARQARRDFKRLMIVEGYMDVVRLHQAGITYAVATLGTATTQEHLNKLFKMTARWSFASTATARAPSSARAMENALALAHDGHEFRFMSCPRAHIPTLWWLQRVRGVRKPTAIGPAAVRIPGATTEFRGGPQARRGRAKLKDLAVPLFARMPDGIYREMVLERLAGGTSVMPAAALRQKIMAAAQTARPAGIRGFPAPRNIAAIARSNGSWAFGGGARVCRRASAGRGNLLSQAITLIVHHPAAARLVQNTEALGGVNKPACRC